MEFSVNPENDASISGGPLNGSYKLDHFELHWGSRQGQGSEHKIDEMRRAKTKVILLTVRLYYIMVSFIFPVTRQSSS